MPAEPSKTNRIGAKGTARRADGAIAAVGAGQHGVVSVGQLLAAGFSRRMINARVAAGRLHRLHRGVYAIGHPGLTAEARWLAAVFACGEGAVLSHASAAALWGIRSTAASLIDVSSPVGTGRRHSGIRVHSTSLHPDDATVRRGVPCTSLPRTVLDLAAVIHPEALDHLVHRAQSSTGLYDPVEMDELLRRSRGRRGVRRVRAVLGYHEQFGEVEANPGLERRFLRLCRRFDLPLPLVNSWIPLPVAAGGLEVDFCWPDHRLIAETDSRAHHATDRAFHNDRARDRALALAGWRVLRFTWRDVAEAPPQVARELRDHLAHVSPSGRLATT
jgi:Transcriptional regulator, AbiEi antitoxin/Protein of unknown function (DUF559)